MPFSGRSLLRHRSPHSYIFDESFRANELRPNGVSSPTWKNGGRIDHWPPTVGTGGPPVTAGYPVEWAEGYLLSGATRNTDIMVRFEDLRLKGYSVASGGWIDIHTQFRPAGSNFKEDYSGSSAATFHSNSPNPLIFGAPATYNCHVFTSGTRPSITLSDIKALVSCVTMKLVSASGVDVRPEVGNWIGRAGIDGWPDAVTGSGNQEIGGASFKLIREYAQRFYYTTMRFADFALYGLPSDIPQLTDTSYTPGLDPYYVP